MYVHLVSPILLSPIEFVVRMTWLTVDWECDRLLLFCIAFYYPLFYVQLDSVKHGVNEGLAFYFVGCPSRPLPH